MRDTANQFLNVLVPVRRLYARTSRILTVPLVASYFRPKLTHRLTCISPCLVNMQRTQYTSTSKQSSYFRLLKQCRSVQEPRTVWQNVPEQMLRMLRPTLVLLSSQHHCCPCVMNVHALQTESCTLVLATARHRPLAWQSAARKAGAHASSLSYCCNERDMWVLKFQELGLAITGRCVSSAVHVYNIQR
jgi:hypothetical protein